MRLRCCRTSSEFFSSSSVSNSRPANAFLQRLRRRLSARGLQVSTRPHRTQYTVVEAAKLGQLLGGRATVGRRGRARERLLRDPRLRDVCVGVRAKRWVETRADGKQLCCRF